MGVVDMGFLLKHNQQLQSRTGAKSDWPAPEDILSSAATSRSQIRSKLLCTRDKNSGTRRGAAADDALLLASASAQICGYLSVAGGFRNGKAHFGDECFERLCGDLTGIKLEDKRPR
jgi:hypothetical protein